jgi:hypothetical protein
VSKEFTKGHEYFNGMNIFHPPPPLYRIQLGVFDSVTLLFSFPISNTPLIISATEHRIFGLFGKKIEKLCEKICCVRAQWAWAVCPKIAAFSKYIC